MIFFNQPADQEIRHSVLQETGAGRWLPAHSEAQVERYPGEAHRQLC